MCHVFSLMHSHSWSQVVPVRGPSISVSFAPLEVYIDKWARRLFLGFCEIDQDLFKDWELGAHHRTPPTHIALMHVCFWAHIKLRVKGSHHLNEVHVVELWPLLL